MPVNIARFEHKSRTNWGVVEGDHVKPLEARFATTGSFVGAASIEAIKATKSEAIPLANVRLLSPVTRNQQFVCQGANYRQHMLESGIDPDAKHFNMIFTKAASCIVAADSPVVMPKAVRFLDYEIELGLIMRRSITVPTEVTAENLADYVAGITVVNDYSARDIQIPQMQFYKGKSFRTFGPIGPWLTLLEPDDYAKLDQLELTLKVDGEVRQQDTTANLVYGPADTLTELSAVQDFAPGDLLATGTPAGCALSIPSSGKQKVAALLPEAKKWELFLKAQAGRTQYLRPGQVVTSHIGSPDGAIDLGTQRNVVVAEEQGVA
ncbi:fumarylacetoacetate hydrolase family protein [Erythrobacter sp. F6033]|uniref:fumarylacetoacetate hydrolase family protein n=1 Tax=Erythrobacter sp. F6033 TaxID=2926401 RepID=UPI001FF15887|nr:fumarylacetoacetate hydrolase family protein [Erythrobacter sp. F6033]MCK0129244.1 fumarylacetoacetate hydrolase family protein [Erythrobacter sp. F6033]